MIWSVDTAVLDRAGIEQSVTDGVVTFRVPGFDHDIHAYLRPNGVDLVPQQSHFHKVLLDRLKEHT